MNSRHIKKINTNDGKNLVSLTRNLKEYLSYDVIHSFGKLYNPYFPCLKTSA